MSASGVPGFGGAVPLAQVPRRAWVEQVMGLPVSVHLRGPDVAGPGPDAVPDGRPDAVPDGRPDAVPDGRPGAVRPPAVTALFAELRAVDALLSSWKPGSELSRLRRGELALADADPLLREVAELCEQARERTEGWFDARRLPAQDGLVGFDPTGLVKGWAVERAARHLAALAGHDYLVSAGGDVVVGCRRTDTPDWTIAIEDPADRSRVIASLPLRTGAVATSGTAARGAHILEPGTGRPATGLRSVTVIGPSLLWADVYATAAFARGPQASGWLATLPNHLSLVVRLDGSTETVTGSPE